MRILRFMGYPINNCSTLERMMLSQALELQRRGHQMEIAFDGIRRAEAAEQARAFAPGVRLHFDLPARAGIRHPWGSLQYLRAARRLIARGNFDIVHLYFDPSARLLNQLARLFPRVRFIRSIGSTPVSRGNRRYLDAIKQRKWVFDVAQMRRLIVVGQHIGEMLVRYGVAPERIAVVPNATDVERFKRLLPHRDGPGLRLGFVGRLSEVKNIELMIEGMRLLVREHGVQDVHLTLVGDGELRASLEASVAASQMQAHIRFAGQVGDIPGMLNRDIDVYVQASHNEGCPAAVIEAMACEVPVVLSRIPGHLQVATPGVHGTYFTAGDARDFVRCIMELRQDYPAYRAQAARARQHIVDTYSIGAWIDQELAVYQGVLSAAEPA